MVTSEMKVRRGEFSNEPFVDFSRPDNLKAMKDALHKFGAELGREYPIYIGAEKITTAEKIRSTNPSHPDQVLAIFQKGTAELANRAIEAAGKAFEEWKRVPAEERAEIVFRVGDLLRQRKFDFA